MTGKNEAEESEDGNSIFSKSPWHMKWDRQQFLPFFTCCLMTRKCKFCYLLYLKEIYAQFVETNVLVKHNIYHELKLTIIDLDLQITWKYPVFKYLHTTTKPMITTHNNKTHDNNISTSQFCQRDANDKDCEWTNTCITATVPNRNNFMNLSMNMWRVWLMWRRNR